MADFKIDGLADLMLDLQTLASLPEQVTEEMLNAQADIVVSAQKSKARALGIDRTGLTIDSIQKSKVKKFKTGPCITVEFKGSRTRGKTKTRNAEIAFINEYGKKNQPARPFVNLANEETEAEQTSAALKVYDNYLKSKNL